MKNLKITIFAVLCALTGASSYAMDVQSMNVQSDENTKPRTQYACSLGNPRATSYYYDGNFRQQDLYLNGNPVGYIIYNDTGQHRQIDYLCLQENMRKKGIGTECMNQFIQQSQRQGIRALGLQALDDVTNFYKRLGFNEVSNDLIFSNMVKTL